MLAFLLMGRQHFLLSQTVDSLTKTFEAKGGTIQHALYEISIQYSTKIYIDPNVRIDQVIRPFAIRSARVDEVLDKVLAGSGLAYLAYEPYLYIISDEARLNNNLFTEYFKKKKSIEDNTLAISSVIGHADSINRSGTAYLQGIVTNGTNDSALNNIIIRFTDLDTFIKSNSKGYFSLHLPVGIHLLSVESEVFQPIQERIKVYGNGALNIKLYEGALTLPEVLISGSARQRVENAQAGVNEISIKEIKRLPSLLGEADVLKALLTLPGVSNTGEVGSGYNVRGGNIDQNLILQDGVFYLNPSHVLGLFSAFNPDAIKNVTLYKGNVPAQYGGRSSSVIDIKLKDPDYQKWSLFGGIGPISSKIFIEGPLVKDRTSFFIGSRFTYSDWVLGLVKDPNLKNSQAGFYDFNFKLSHRLSPKSTIQFSTYRSKDDFNYAQQFGYGWMTQSYNLTFSQQIKSRLLVTGSMIYSDNKNSFDDKTTAVSNTLNNGLAYYKSKWNLTWQPSNKHTIRTGVEGTRYLPHPQRFQASADQDIIQENIPQSKGDEMALYFNDEFSLTRHLNLSLGYRFSAYRNVGAERVYTYQSGLPRLKENITSQRDYAAGESIKWYRGSEPRLSLAYVLSDQSSIKMSYNRLFQYIHLVSNTAAATPVDLWQLSNSYLEPQQANNFSLGYFKNFNQSEWETSVEVYYKKLNRLVEYKDFAKLLRNPNIETELFPVIGKSYGAELFIKRLKNNPTGYVSYTLSRSLRKSPGLFPDEVINNGQWYASNFDKPHNLNIVFDLQIRKTMFFSANFVYATGRPQTTPISEFYLGDGIFLNYSQRNSLRIPDYHRLDLSMTFTRGAIRRSKNKGSWTIAIYNFYARKNAFSVFYRRTPNQPYVAYKLAVLGTALPSITYNFQF